MKSQLPAQWGITVSAFAVPAGFAPGHSYPANPDILQQTPPDAVLGPMIEVLPDQELEIFHLSSSLTVAGLPAGANLSNIGDANFELDLLDGSKTAINTSPILLSPRAQPDFKIVGNPDGIANNAPQPVFLMPYFRFRARDFAPSVRFVQCFFNLSLLTGVGGGFGSSVLSTIGVRIIKAGEKG